MSDYYDANPMRVPRVPISLIGFFGAGQEVIGTKVAALTGLNHLDVRQLMTHEAGASPAKVFLDLGPEYFRRLASKSLNAGVASQPPGVLSLPHDMLDSEDDRDTVLRKTALVYLHQEFESMVRKVRAQVEERPGVFFPWISPDRVCAGDLEVMFDEKRPAYEGAVLQIDVTDKASVTIAREIVDHFELWTEE